MEGTYPLPEAQLDRFLMKLIVTYPSRQDLSYIVERTLQRDETELETIIDAPGILSLRRTCRDLLVAKHIQDYAIDLVMATQPSEDGSHELARKYIRYGSSPRGAQALVECGRVLALMSGRVHVSTDDIRTVAPAVLRHRIIMNFDAHADGQTPDSLLTKIIYSVTAAVS
jgi:MoxR-like ATPase